jgi:hypothetical protein
MTLTETWPFKSDPHPFQNHRMPPVLGSMLRVAPLTYSDPPCTQTSQASCKIPMSLLAPLWVARLRRANHCNFNCEKPL